MLDPDLKALMEELLTPLGPVAVRRMFGGGGIFLDGLMFGLISDGVLYLKADDANRPAFETEGLSPFAYDKKGGRTTIMSYWRTPDRLLDEPDELVDWARAAYGAALRSRKPNRAKSAAKKGRSTPRAKARRGPG